MWNWSWMWFVERKAVKYSPRQLCPQNIFWPSCYSPFILIYIITGRPLDPTNAVVSCAGGCGGSSAGSAVALLHWPLQVQDCPGPNCWLNLDEGSPKRWALCSGDTLCSPSSVCPFCPHSPTGRRSALWSSSVPSLWPAVQPSLICCWCCATCWTLCCFSCELFSMKKRSSRKMTKDGAFLRGCTPLRLKRGHAGSRTLCCSAPLEICHTPSHIRICGKKNKMGWYLIPLLIVTP